MDSGPASAANQYDELLEHGDTLLRYALARVADRATAEDLVQDTFVAAVGQMADFARASTVRTWLIGILKHKIVDHFRWRERHPGDHAGATGETFGDNDDPWFTAEGTWKIDPNAGLERLDLDPANAVERTQLRAALQWCIDHLPPQLRRVFVLREIEELEPEPICDVAAVARESLAVFLYRARQSLRACMQKKWLAP